MGGAPPPPGARRARTQYKKPQLVGRLEGENRSGVNPTIFSSLGHGSSVGGFLFHHRDRNYYADAILERDRVKDFARRKGMSVTEVERWLAPNLGYDAD
ncbi:hypothetical protein KCA24_02450 [Escherichia coli]|nr:hypothetical protein [Escherichia coli]